jgi:hypothetical protein
MNRRDEVVDYLAERPYMLSDRSNQDPQQLADTLEAAYLVVEREASKREDANEWARIKANSRTPGQYWEPGS